MPRGRAPAPSPTSNRTDLVNPAPQPVSAVPDQGYGKAGDQMEAQRIAPMAGGATSPPGGSAPPPGANPNDLMAALQNFNGPGGSLKLNRPTERPNEPGTHGLPIGPGAGPEALTGVGAAARDNAVEDGTLKNVLMNMAQSPGATSAIRDLAARALGGAL